MFSIRKFTSLCLMSGWSLVLAVENNCWRCEAKPDLDGL